MKDDFLATLSHELRTPLNAILGWAKILRSGKVDAEDLEEGLSAIERNAQAQAQLIEDLLDISRIISGNLRLDVQRLDLSEVIEAALAAVMPAANAKGIRIHKVLDSLAGPVTGDFARLQQVVWNLLSNAVKFTPKGGKVQVLLERVNSHVEITVIDTGIGHQARIPARTSSTASARPMRRTTRRHGGLGLGLAIVKQLVEMHGGTIRAKSPGEGQGATFTVTLPITVVHPERPGPEKVRPKEAEATEEIRQEGALAGLKVLVVDDEPDARQLIHRVLVDCQAEVALAASAAEALDLVERFRPDVIVSDIGMPEQDGYDLIRQVRANPRPRTSRPSPSPRSPAPRTGNGPCSPASRPMSPSPSIRPNSRPPSPASPAGPAGATQHQGGHGMKAASLRILIVDDNADNARMLKVLLKGEGHEVRIAFDGPEAIEAAKLYKPDVVLLDLSLPSMSGVDVADGASTHHRAFGVPARRRLRPRRGKPAVPVAVRSPLPEARGSRRSARIPLSIPSRVNPADRPVPAVA